MAELAWLGVLCRCQGWGAGSGLCTVPLGCVLFHGAQKMVQVMLTGSCWLCKSCCSHVSKHFKFYFYFSKVRHTCLKI